MGPGRYVPEAAAHTSNHNNFPRWTLPKAGRAIKHSILDLVSDLRLTLRIELVKNATLDQAIEVKQQNLVNSQIKCKVVLASNFTTLDGDQTSVYKMNQDNVNGSVRSW